MCLIGVCKTCLCGSRDNQDQHVGWIVWFTGYIIVAEFYAIMMLLSDC